MKRPFNKKRFWLIVAILALVEAVILCVALQWKYIFPSREVSDLYTRYENVDGIDVSYIKDYKVNDSVFVDVTLIEATTDSAWNLILNDFNITPPPLEVIEITGEDCIDIWAAPKKDYSMPMDSLPLNNDLIAMLWAERKISVFSIETTQQLRSLKRNQFKESISKSQNSNNRQNEQND